MTSSGPGRRLYVPRPATANQSADGRVVKLCKAFDRQLVVFDHFFLTPLRDCNCGLFGFPIYTYYRFKHDRRTSKALDLYRQRAFDNDISKGKTLAHYYADQKVRVRQELLLHS